MSCRIIISNNNSPTAGFYIWGDLVNIASRFEACGHPEKIHVTTDVKKELGDRYIFEDCGEVLIKGKGMMRSYFLSGKKAIGYHPAYDMAD